MLHFIMLRLTQTTNCWLMSISCCPIAGYMECLPMSFYDTPIHFKIIVSSTLHPYCLVHSSKQLTAVCSESSALAWKYQLFFSFCRLFDRDNAVRIRLAALGTHLLSQNETVQRHYDSNIMIRLLYLEIGNSLERFSFTPYIFCKGITDSLLFRG